MSTATSSKRQRIDPEMRNLGDLPDDCLATIISVTSPRDACRLSVVSPSFNSAARSNTVWGKFLPANYQNLVPELPGDRYLKILYFNLFPVLIEGGRKSFSLHKWSGKICYMLAARDLAIAWGNTPHYWKWHSIQDSRFPECAELLLVCWFEITGRIGTCKLSSTTRYKAYLVFRLAARFSGFTNQPIEATVRLAGTIVLQRTVFLHAEGDDVQNNLPRERGDGWLELELGEFFNEGGEDGELEIRIFSFNGGGRAVSLLKA